MTRRRTAMPAPEPRDDAGAKLPPAARALWFALAVTLALRAAAAIAPGRWVWGLDLGRDLPAMF